MACAVRSCRNEIFKRRDLSFFGLPKHQHVRDEWLEILGIESKLNLNSIKVCELHFKPKDFGTGKKHLKQLKDHAVPALRLGSAQEEPINSDEEFMDYSSEGDIDVVTLSPKHIKLKDLKIQLTDIKKEPLAIKKEEPVAEAVTEGRRPSRRAAREAAKKIYNTVRNFMPVVDQSATPLSSPSSPYIAMPRQRKSSNVKSKPLQIDLLMECQEDILSPAQAEALLKAQLEYNMVMKTLRNLKANNVKIICAKEPYPLVSQPSTISTVPLKTATKPLSSIANSNPPKIVTINLPSNSIPVI